LRRKQQDRDSAFIFEIYAASYKAHEAPPATALYIAPNEFHNAHALV